MGSVITIKTTGLKKAEAAGRRFKRLDAAKLTRAVTRQALEDATDRLRVTKKTPEGFSFKPWSESYAKTRKPQHSIGIDTGAMVAAGRAESSRLRGRVIYRGIPYARAFGAVRPFLGVGPADKLGIMDLARAHLKARYVS